MYEENCSIDSVLHRMQSTLACRICLDLLSNPLTSKCGHTFCKECLDRLHISGKASYPCPLCMTPITRRSLNQNTKISSLVFAVRNVISSIKQDCGVQENKNVASGSEMKPEEEMPIRRMTRNNKPLSYIMNESFANSRKKYSKKNKDKEDIVENDGDKACEENKLTKTSLKDSTLNVNGDTEDTIHKKPTLNKVEQWLSKNESVICDKNDDDFQDLQPTQIFNIDDDISRRDVCKENSCTNDENMWRSQCSTIIFNPDDEFLICNNDVTAKATSSKECMEYQREETNSILSEKENEKVTSDVRQKERRGNKRILFEPNKIDVKKTLKELDTRNKDTECENLDVNPVPSVNKSNGKNIDTQFVDSLNIVKHLRSEENLQDDYKHPNKKGHNIRFASTLKVQCLEKTKPSKLLSRGRGRGRKSPGWSRIEGARRDLRSKKMNLKITGGEQKSFLSDVSKLDTSKINVEFSQESVVIIDDQTQTEKRTPLPPVKKRMILPTINYGNSAKSETFNKSYDNKNVSSKTEPKTSPKLKELELKLTRVKKPEVSQICKTEEENNNSLNKEIVNLAPDTFNVQSFKEPVDIITQPFDANKMSGTGILENDCSKSKFSMEAKKESVNIDNFSIMNCENLKFPKPNFNKSKLSLGRQESCNLTKVNDVDIEKNNDFNNSMPVNRGEKDVYENDDNAANIETVNENFDEPQNVILKDSTEVRKDKSASVLNEQKTSRNGDSKISQNIPVTFISKGKFDTVRSEPDSSCHHSIPCELFHVLVKYSKFLINKSQETRCLYYEENRLREKTTINHDCVAPLSESTVVSDSCADNVQNVAIMLPEVPGTSFRQIDYLDKEISDNVNDKAKDLILEVSENNNTFKEANLKHSKGEETLLNQNLKPSQKDVKQKYSNSQPPKDHIEKDLFSENNENEEEGLDSLSVLSNQKPSKSLSADSPIVFKRNRRSKRIESPSSSDDELEICRPEKKKARISILSNSSQHEVENNSRIDSEEMRDFERYDENVWYYFKNKSEDSKNCADLENAHKKIIQRNNEQTIVVERIDDSSDDEDDDVIPGTEEVLKNIESDIPCEREEKDDMSNLKLEKSNDTKVIGKTIDTEVVQNNRTVDLFSQDSAVTTSTTCLNSSVRELFNKCNTSLHNANKILNHSHILTQDTEEIETNIPKEVESNIYNNDKDLLGTVSESHEKEEQEIEEKKENESHFSMLSTESPVLCTQQKKEMESEVEALRKKIEALEKEVDQKKAQLSNGNQSSSKTDTENSAVKENCGSSDLKESQETGKESDVESEELFTTFPVDVNKKCFSLRNGRSLVSSSKSFMKKRKPITIICTGLNQGEISATQTFSSTLCGSDSKVVNTWSEDITHVIVKTDEEGMTQRTLKYLLGVVTGCWVVSNSWINDSLSSKVLLPEDEYEALDCTGAPGPNRARKNKNKLFSTFQFVLFPPFQDIVTEQFIKLITKCDGLVLEKFDEEKSGPKLFVIDSEDPNFSERKKLSKLTVGHDWIIECIGNYAHVALTNYLIGHNTESEIINSEIPLSLILETQEII